MPIPTLPFDSVIAEFPEDFGTEFAVPPAVVTVCATAADVDSVTHSLEDEDVCFYLCICVNA